MRKYVLATALALACAALLAFVSPRALAGPAASWGRNYYGQLGDGSNTDRLTPVQVLDLTTVTKVAAGESHSLALLADGTLRSFGRNNFGQLGDGTTDNRNTPVQVLYLTNVVALAGGSAHSLAVKSDGTAWAWGRNQYGQLGDGGSNNRSEPWQVTGLSGAVGVAAGEFHSLALKSDGTMRAWGRNNYGQLGDGSTTDRSTPVQVQNLTNVVAIGAGLTHSLAVKSNGTVWAWGRNNYGQLGDGTTNNSTTPVQVQNLTNVVAVAGGQYHSIALKSDGTVWAWGRNIHGQLGDGTNEDRLTPVQVANLTNVVAIASGEDHCLAVKSDGTVWAWGFNMYGQLGNGTTTSSNRPVQVSGLTDVVAVAAGYDHSLAVIRWRTAMTTADRSGTVSYPVVLMADLRQVTGNLPVDGATVSFEVEGSPVGTAVTGGGGTSGRAELEWLIPEGPTNRTIFAEFAGDAVYQPSFDSGTLTCSPCPTETTVPDRTGTITETVTLYAYLKRLSDNAWVNGRTVGFSVDGTLVGSAVTGAGGTDGRADFDWIIPDGPPTRTIEGSFEGDQSYEPSSGSGTLTCQTWETKMATFDRTQRITGQTELKCRLVRIDNVPVAHKAITFSVDGTPVAIVTTDSNGYARHPYVVPDAGGAGERTVLSDWPGDGGYAPTSKTATLTVLPAVPYIWVMPKSAAPGKRVNLYAYFRRLYDYKPQELKTVQFLVDGTVVGETTTGAGPDRGIARYELDTSGMDVGAHTLRCAYQGDPWMDAGYGDSMLTIERATPVIWVRPITAARGETVKLYAYLRRLYDYLPQQSKLVHFMIDGKPVATVWTGTGADAGKARYLYDTSDLEPGDHTIRCKFDGDITLAPGFGEAILTIY